MAVTAQDYQSITTMVDQIKQRYPAFQYLLGIPDIAKLLIEASAPGAQWTTAKFQAELHGTQWWRQNSDTAKTWITTELTDPAEAARQRAAMAVQLHTAAATEGISLAPADLSSLVDQSLRESWTGPQIQMAIAQHAAQGTLRPGTIQNTATQLGSTAADYGVPLSGRTAFDWAQRIAEGTATADSFTAYAQDQAKSLFPHLKDKIDQGFTVRQIADPYMQIAAQNGVIANPAEANLSDPKWSRALQSRDAQGNIQGPMTLADWSRTIMTDPTYGFDRTPQAREAATNLVQSLGQAMGVYKQ